MSDTENNAPPERSVEATAAPVPESSGAPATAAPELPEDLRAPWDWLDLVIFAAFGLGSLIALNRLLATLAIALAGVPPAEIERFVSTNTPFVVLRQTLWFAVLLLFLFAMIQLRFRVPFWRTIGWRELRPRTMPRLTAVLLCLVSGAVLSLAVRLASVFVAPTAPVPMEAFFQTRESVLLMMAAGILVAPLAEETIFRGFLYPVLARGLGVTLGVLLTGFVFGRMHAAQLGGEPAYVGLLTIVGIVLTYVRASTGTVLASYLLHLGYNTYIFAGFYFATEGLRKFPGAS